MNDRVCSFVSKLAALVLSILPLSLRGAPLDQRHPAVRSVIRVQSEVTQTLMRQPEILGTAVGVNSTNAPVLTVFVDRNATNASELIHNLPHEFRGIPVQVHLTDKFRAMIGPPVRGRVSHTARQTPPIQLGTSGGWDYDLANGYCCGGTLGALVSISGMPYILSNYHVFESDTVLGGNNRVAQTGDSIIQPGLIDVSCNATGARGVAKLVKKSSLPGSNVDCSIGQVVSGMVRSDGAILEIGTVSHSTISASINQAVKKSGRTTGLTRSKVTALNATITVTYDNECAGASAFTKTFTGQIVIDNNGNKFLNGGDSGSLMVEDVTPNPRPVGLLFAGSSTSAIANPIDDVLTFLGATIVGN